jgi:hypothetical protein
MGAIRSSETSVKKIPTRPHIPEDGILHSHRRENLKSHISLSCFMFVSVTNYKINKFLIIQNINNIPAFSESSNNGSKEPYAASEPQFGDVRYRL